MHTISLSNGKKFSAQVGESLLDAARRNSINLSYSCKTGRCSTCKCKLLCGSTDLLQAEHGLTPEEKAEGWILSCVRSAISVVTLEATDLGDVDIPESRTWPCRISEINRLADDVVQVFLRLPSSTNFYFIPGQYVDIVGPNGIRRSYSLANPDFSKKLLELHIRAVAGGEMSDYWFGKAKPGDLLRLNGPQGTFFLREVMGVDLIFLATGTGIAPVKAMLESIAKLPPEGRPKSLTVLWGGRREKDLYLDLQKTPLDFTFFPVLSRPGADWAGAVGYVQDVLCNYFKPFSSAVVYACGSYAMTHSAKAKLVDAGLSDKNFHSDAFVASGFNQS